MKSRSNNSPSDDESSGPLCDMSAEELARRSQLGGAEAFRVLMDRHMAVLERFLAKRCGRHDIEDVRQETLLKVWTNLDRYDFHRPFAPWLFTVARNVALNSFNAGKRRLQPSREAEVEDVPAAQAKTDDDGPSIWLAAKEALNERQYGALWLRHGMDMPIRQVAKEMGISENHARVMLFRARQVLLRCPQMRQFVERPD